MRDDDLHLPEALCGALMALLLLVAVFVSTPASAAIAVAGQATAHSGK
jgi:hypothetical protein